MCNQDHMPPPIPAQSGPTCQMSWYLLQSLSSPHFCRICNTTFHIKPILNLLQRSSRSCREVLRGFLFFCREIQAPTSLQLAHVVKSRHPPSHPQSDTVGYFWSLLKYINKQSYNVQRRGVSSPPRAADEAPGWNADSHFPPLCGPGPGPPPGCPPTRSPVTGRGCSTFPHGGGTSPGYFCQEEGEAMMACRVSSLSPFSWLCCFPGHGHGGFSPVWGARVVRLEQGTDSKFIPLGRFLPVESLSRTPKVQPT